MSVTQVNNALSKNRKLRNCVRSAKRLIPNKFSLLELRLFNFELFHPVTCQWLLKGRNRHHNTPAKGELKQKDAATVVWDGLVRTTAYETCAFEAGIVLKNGVLEKMFGCVHGWWETELKNCAKRPMPNSNYGA